MHWLLSIPDDFSLREVIRRSGWLLRPPFHVPPLKGQLTRLESLDGENAIELAVSQAPAGLVLQTTARLSGQEVQGASQRVWRMLRLDEDLRPFLRAVRRSEALTSTARLGARLLRGTTLFEDVLTAVGATWEDSLHPSFRLVSALVDRLGTPLPANPTLHTFPNPQRILAGRGLLSDVFSPDLTAQILHVARLFAEDTTFEELIRCSVATDELAHELRRLTGITPPNLGLLMLHLGRYHYVPTDWVARERLRRYRQLPESSSREIATHDVLRFFERWQPWGGLAYWLWDWSKVPELTADR